MTVLGVGSNLLVRDGGVPGVVVRLGRGFAEVAVDGETIVAGAGALDVNVARVAAGCRPRRSGVPVRHSRHHRRRAAHERRRLRQRDQGRAGVGRGRRSARRRAPAGAAPSWASAIAAAALPDDWIFTAAALRGQPGDAAAIAGRMDGDPDGAREHAADAVAHRRLDLRQSAGQQGLGADRPRRLPRPGRRRCAGVREALQLPDQHRRRHRGRPRDAGRGSAPAGAGGDRRQPRMGNPPHRRAGGTGPREVRA